MANNFSFIIPLKKNVGDMLTGIASTTSIDRDGERMSDKALQMMVEDIKTVGVNLFGNHSHEWENTLGVIKNARLNSSNQVEVDITLDDATTNPKIPALLNKLKRGINLGLSVGGNVESTKEEYSKTLGRKVKILDKVKIYEVSVVGIPSNADAYVSIPQAIAKSMKEKGKKLAPCKNCGKETYNETSDWTGFCSRECEQEYNKEKSCPICFGKMKKSERHTCVECGTNNDVNYSSKLDDWYCGKCKPNAIARLNDSKSDEEKSCPVCYTKMKKEKMTAEEEKKRIEYEIRKLKTEVQQQPNNWMPKEEIKLLEIELARVNDEIRNRKDKEKSYECPACLYKETAPSKCPYCNQAKANIHRVKIPSGPNKGTEEWMCDECFMYWGGD